MQYSILFLYFVLSSYAKVFLIGQYTSLTYETLIFAIHLKDKIGKVIVLRFFRTAE